MHGTTPKVSVIIPAYNRETFIAQTIDSVLGQTYSNVELIVVDDGSTDGTRKVVDTYKGRITILEHPGRVNRGQSAAINVGLRKATGKYIAILDSDDYWAPEKLDVLVGYLEAHPETGVVYSNGFAVDANGNELYRIYARPHSETNDPCRVLLDCYFLLPNNAVVRRSIMEQAGEFDESLRSAQDHDMAIRVSELTKLAYIDQGLFFYRRHENSISNRNALLRWRNGFKILVKAKRRYPYPRSVIRRRAAVLHFRLFQCLMENRKPLSAIYHLGLAGLKDPLRSIGVATGRERISGPH